MLLDVKTTNKPKIFAQAVTFNLLFTVVSTSHLLFMLHKNDFSTWCAKLQIGEIETWTLLKPINLPVWIKL